MKYKNSISQIIFASSVILLLSVGCTSTQESEELNSGEADPVSSSDTQEGETVNSAGANAAVNQSGEGEAMNNAVDNEFADTGFNDSLGLNNQAATTDAPQNSLTTDEGSAALFGANANTTAANAALTNAATAPATGSNPAANAALAGSVDPAAMPAASPTDTPPAAPTTGGIVKYVITTSPISDVGGGSQVGSLEQGDHPLVWDEGQYVRMANGKFLPASSLSEKGIGRDRKTANWATSGR